MQTLILFDVDGTLLTTDGAAKRAFHRSLLDVYGTAGSIAAHDFAGKTDPQIARELLAGAGLADAVIEHGFGSFWPVYLRNLAAELLRPHQRTTLLPGVRELLEALDQRRDLAVCGLLTGNVQAGAALKLSAAGLADRFPLGAYGSDHERRDCLPAIALERARDFTGRAFRGPEVVIIGDTPHDVTCGRSLGVRTLAVATGAHDAATLSAAGADRVVSDLAATARVADWLLSIP